MAIFKKAIFTAASPNTELNDVITAIKLLFNPRSWTNEKLNIEFSEMLKKYINVSYVHLIDSGRSALEIALRSLRLQQTDEVLVPSFTCVVVANSVKYSGATPVYLDTSKEDFNGDYENILNYVNENTKAIIVQHTFGKRVDVELIRDKIKSIGRNNIFILEDFAHIIHEEINLKGDIGFTTFGIEKVFSTVRGGAIITNQIGLSKNIETFIKKLPEFPNKQLIKCLLNPIFWYVAIPLHSVGFGRFTIGAFIRSIWRKLGFLGIMVEESENRAIKPNWFPARMSPALSKLGIIQLEKLHKYNNHREIISKIYNLHLSKFSDEEVMTESRLYLRYPIILPSEEKFKEVWDYARSIRVTLGNWFSTPLYGATVNENTYADLCFVPATTPVTMQKAGLTLNLPTSINISVERARELADGIKKVLEN